MNFEEVGCNFKDWLVAEGYLNFEEGLAEEQMIIDDLTKAYEVAPRLVNLIKNIADK